MNVLVTGANGFIGRALCERQLAEGWQVRGAVRSKVSGVVLPAGIEAVSIGSVGSDTDWGEALGDIDTVVHLAARVHVMDDAASEPLAAYRRVNVEGTKCLAIAAANAGVKRFVFISTIKVNGEKTGKRDERPTSNIERPTSNEKQKEQKTEEMHILFAVLALSKKEKHPLDIPDLKTALIYAEQDIKDRWKWYRDRYRKRLKNEKRRDREEKHLTGF